MSLLVFAVRGLIAILLVAAIVFFGESDENIAFFLCCNGISAVFDGLRGFMLVFRLGNPNHTSLHRLVRGLQANPPSI
jgi:hypothetical protein